MRLLLLVLLSGSISVVNLSCAHAPDDASVADVDDVGELSDDNLLAEEQEVAEPVAEVDSLDVDSAENVADAEQPADDELSEGDLEISSADEPMDESFENELAQAEEPPPPTDMETGVTLAPIDESQTQMDSDLPGVEVTSIEFRAASEGGTVYIKTSEPTEYTSRINSENQQIVIEIPNAKLPSRFMRPYNTKEFPGPIIGIQGYQPQGSKTARIVIQLREMVEPNIQQVGNAITVAPTTLTASDDSSSDTAKSALTNRTLDDYLLGQSKFYGRKISIQFRDADIRDVFNFISEESGLNVILTDDVQGKVSLKLRQVPWDQALIVIMKSKQLGYVRQGNVLRISTLATLQKEADSARNVIESQAKLKPLRVRVFPVSYAKVTDLEAQAKDFLSDRGKVKGDARTNSLIVNDVEENIERIGRLVEVLDTETPQVLIEAKIIEARQEFQRRVGINWNLRNSNIPMGQFGETPLSAKPEFTMRSMDGAPIYSRLQIGTFDFLGDIDATLNLFESEGIVRVISSPRVVTLNNIKANIEQTTQIPYRKVDTTTAGSTETTQFKDVTLKLDVQPQITADGGVIMAVQVAREFPGAALGTGDRPINKRQASTTLLVKNGQTTVLGGIYQSDVSEREDGVPFLRKLPIIGGIFRNRVRDKDKNELMIFMTPRILNKDRAFRHAKGGE